MATVETNTVMGTFTASAENNPGVLSNDHRAMMGYWNLIDSLLGGVEAMRKGGEKYLPRFHAERDKTRDDKNKLYDPYAERLAQTPFTAIYEDLALNLSSKPFQKECRLEDEGSTPEMKRLAEDIDMQGNDLHVFSAWWFWQAVNYAIGWVMIDHTRAPTVLGEDGQPRQPSLADERAAGIRPYWVHIPAKRVLAAFTDVVRGRETLVHITIEEQYKALNQFIEVDVTRIRHIWRPVTVTDGNGRPLDYGPPQFMLWETRLDTTTQQTAWTVVEQGTYIAAGGKPLSEIPVVWFVTGQREPGSFVVKPPLRSLAWMQVYEYQQEANLQNILTMTSFPMLAGQGVTKPTDSPVVGPRQILYAPVMQNGNHGTWEIIEPTGSSIEQVRKELEETRKEMRELGKQPLSMANLTVISSGMVEAKASTVAQMWALLFQDACERAWQITAEWMGIKAMPKVFVFKDFTASFDGSENFKDVLAMRTSGDLSRENALKAAVRFGRLPDDFDYDENETQLADEGAPAQNELPIDPLTGRPILKAPPALAGKPPVRPPVNGQGGQGPIQ